MIARSGPRVLVIGRSGQVASALRLAAIRQDVDLVAVGRPDVDITRRATLEEAFRRHTPAIVINAAAYTAVDRAEAEIAAATAANAEGPRHIAGQAAAAGIPLLHLSTDYVYDGRKPGPYVEDDEANPLSVYGRTKLDGDKAVLATPGLESLVFRTAWIYAAAGNNFVLKMLRFARSRRTVAVVSDQWGIPTAADDIAHALLGIAMRIVRESLAGRGGIYHLTGTGESTSWAGFAEEIFRQAQSFDLPSATVQRISSTEFPTAAVRPANSRLDTNKLARTWGVTLPDWRDSLGRCLGQIAANKEWSEELVT